MNHRRQPDIITDHRKPPVFQNHGRLVKIHDLRMLSRTSFSEIYKVRRDFSLICRRQRRYRLEPDLIKRRQKRIKYKTGNLLHSIRISQALINAKGYSDWLSQYLSSNREWIKIVVPEVCYVAEIIVSRLHR